MGQINPLRRDELINEIGIRDFEIVKKETSLKPFLEFKEDENYQVPVSLIAKLTGLNFKNALDRHADIKPTILKLEEVQIRSFEDITIDKIFPYNVTGLLL